jgi:hypothetical protein
VLKRSPARHKIPLISTETWGYNSGSTSCSFSLIYYWENCRLLHWYFWENFLIQSFYVSTKIKSEMQKLSLYETTKMWLYLSLILKDIFHVFREKCKSRITIHVKVKTLKRKEYHISNSDPFRKERTHTSIYLCLTWLQVLCSFKLLTHHLTENQTLLNYTVLQYLNSFDSFECDDSLGKSHWIH